MRNRCVVAAVVAAVALSSACGTEVTGRALAGSTTVSEPSEPTKSPEPPEPPEPSGSSGSSEEPFVPGWQTVRLLNAAYDVPPDWEIQTGRFSDGTTFDQPIYRKGFCEGHPKAYLGIVFPAGSTANDTRSALAMHYQRVLSQFDGRNPRIDLGDQTGTPDTIMRQGARITAEPAGPCPPEVTAVYLVAIKFPGENGCYILEVRASQNVPNAVPEEHLAKITGSFRVR